MSAAGRGRAALAFGRGVLGRTRDADVPFLSAAIAYYALVSVVPALVLVVAVATTVGGDALAEQVRAATGGLLTPSGQAAVADALTSAAGRAGASALGVALLAWSALKVFRGLDTAFSRIYGTSDVGRLLDEVRDAVLVLVSVGAALGGMFALGAALAALPVPVAGWTVGLAGLLVGLFVAFLPLYYVFPDARVELRAAVPGAAVAAVGWVALQAIFQVYAAVAPSFELYGVLGGVLLLVTWFYLAAQLLLVGAVVNAELARDDRQAEEPAGRAIG